MCVWIRGILRGFNSLFASMHRRLGFKLLYAKNNERNIYKLNNSLSFRNVHFVYDYSWSLRCEYTWCLLFAFRWKLHGYARNSRHDMNQRFFLFTKIISVTEFCKGTRTQFQLFSDNVTRISRDLPFFVWRVRVARMYFSTNATFFLYSCCIYDLTIKRLIIFAEAMTHVCPC